VHELPDHEESRVVKDLLRTSDLKRDEIVYLLDEASSFRHDPGRKSDLLRGRIVVLYFAKPSTRTRLSFEAAVASLGGIPAVVGPDELQLGRGETIEDTARVISRYAAAFVLRTFSDEELAIVAESATIPVVNALTDGHHPMQSLAVLLTFRERLHHFADR
jgi:ornithine carbamoyltransferase